ncbi:MAG: nucleoside-diphosphate sugar epimerase/dehydratase [bacterium]|nr:nucleoside-diphosphate sugar epimerase/dehydratase [bacterium]
MKKRVLIIGAGEAGSMMVREISAHPQSGLEVVGFLDDDVSLHGKSVEGFTVIGAIDTLLEVVSSTNVDDVIMAVPSGGRDLVRRVVRLCRDAGVEFRIVPGLIEIIRGSVGLEQLREVHPEDLLGRQTVEFDGGAIRDKLAGQRVMVTGAGGSIGGEICRQVGRFDLEELQLVGRGENQIYNIEQEIRSMFPSLPVRSIIADIRDRRGLATTFSRFNPEFVYHAAAHKHVHYMEAYPEEAVKNNVFGTANVIHAARESGVGRVVMLSTDKAVRPQGVMGATKRVAEYLMVDANGHSHKTRLITVRFGNVLGSRGSVVPLFINQIRSGGPVTVSDERATRFFMTLNEACMLVVQASLMGEGGEVFILKMGGPIRILEMAKDLIAMHGLRADDDIKIEITGLREGEKLHEDLIVEEEETSDSSHDYILCSQPRLPDGWETEMVLGRLRDLTERGDEAGIYDFLGSIIPDAQMGKS